MPASLRSAISAPRALMANLLMRRTAPRATRWSKIIKRQTRRAGWPSGR